jgi:hypothetical protein
LVVGIFAQLPINVLTRGQAQLYGKEDQDHLLQVHHSLHDGHAVRTLEQICCPLNILVLEIAVNQKHHVDVEQ